MRVTLSSSGECGRRRSTGQCRKVRVGSEAWGRCGASPADLALPPAPASARGRWFCRWHRPGAAAARGASSCPQLRPLGCSPAPCLCLPHPSSPPPSSLGTPSTVLVYNYFYNTPVVMSAAVTQVRSSSASHVRGEGTSGLAQTPIASRLSVLTPTLTKHDVSCENTSAFPRHGLEAEGCACTPQALGPTACSGGCSGQAPRAEIGAFLV